jgi:hypothetical protein
LSEITGHLDAHHDHKTLLSFSLASRQFHQLSRTYLSKHLYINHSADFARTLSGLSTLVPNPKRKTPPSLLVVARAKSIIDNLQRYDTLTLNYFPSV